MLIRLDEITKTTPNVGKKARRLAKLMGAGFSVPEGFVITSDSFSDCFSGIEKELSTQDDVITKSSRLQNAFSNARISQEVESDAAKQYLEMELIPNLPKNTARFIMAGRDIPVAAVRLSGETDYPFAHAILNVYGQKQLLFSIRKALSSVLSSQMLDFAKKKGISPQNLVKNSIVIQKFIPGEIFGTVMKHPAKEGWLVEYANADNFFNGILYGSTDPKRVEVTSSTEEAHVMEGKYSIDKMIENAKKAEEILGESVCLEWCIARDRIYVLDARPLGTVNRSVSGKVRKTLSNIGHEDVVVLENCNSEFFPMPEKFAGIICEHGSYSSSLANCCRQLGIPFFIMDASGMEENQNIDISNGISPIMPKHEIDIEKTDIPVQKAETKSCTYDRITKLGVILQPKTVFTENNSHEDFDEVIITDRDYLSLADSFSKPVSYLLKNEEELETLKNSGEKFSSLRILFDNFEPEIITKVKAEFPNSKTGFVVKTPYDMLRIREIQPFANAIIYDIANIVKLMINRESDDIDDNMLKQLRNSMKTCKDHGITCYCCNFSNDPDDELLKKLILIGSDGIIVKQDQASLAGNSIERAEKKIMLEMARKSFQF